jgi:hypothetical protein
MTASDKTKMLKVAMGKLILIFFKNGIILLQKRFYLKLIAF